MFPVVATPRRWWAGKLTATQLMLQEGRKEPRNCRVEGEHAQRVE